MDKQLGLEATLAEFVANLVRVFRLVREALAPHGTVWLNIGDSYSSGSRTSQSDPAGSKLALLLGGKPGMAGSPVRPPANCGIPAGNLCLIPWRLAIALQDDGWLVRSVVVWHKPAPMPASLSGWAWRRCRVKAGKGNGRVDPKHRGRREHGLVSSSSGLHTPGWREGETVASQWADCPGCPKCSPHGGFVLRRGSWRPTSSWEPVLLLAKGPSYYADGEAVKTPVTPATVGRRNYSFVYDDGGQYAAQHDHENWGDSGANLRDVWTIAAEPLKERHYAAFPSELVYRCLAAGTSARGYCPSCGAPWCRVIEKAAVGAYHDHAADGVEYGLRQDGRGPAATYDPGKTVGWRPSCSCIGADCLIPRPGLVLDPFCGSGRTGIQARRLGLDFVGVELSPQYADLAEKLLRDDCPLFSE